MNSLQLTANDAIDSGTVEVYISDNVRSYTSPVGITFRRLGSGGKTVVNFSFNMRASEAKRLALYILERL